MKSDSGQDLVWELFLQGEGAKARGLVFAHAHDAGDSEIGRGQELRPRVLELFEMAMTIDQHSVRFSLKFTLSRFFS